jgi:hypothetical protein
MEDSSNDIKLEYYRPMFHRRVFADIIDILLMLCFAILSFMGLRAIFQNSNEYQFREQRMNSNRESSGIYVYNETKYTLITDYYASDSSITSKELMGLYSSSLDTFLVYLQTNVTNEEYMIVKNDYDTFRLGVKLDEVPYFVTINNEVVKNSASKATYAQYNENVYKPYLTDHAEGYFTVYAPHFIEDSHYFAYIVLFAEIPIAILIGSILAFYIPPLFFKRNRQTLGKWLYKIGRTDSHILSVKFGRYTAESAILIFAITLLSLYTLGVPLIISFSMMVFSKKRQDFADYMLGINEVDLSSSKIYYSFDELRLESENKALYPVSFDTKNNF